MKSYVASETYAKEDIAEREATKVRFSAKYQNLLVGAITYIHKFIEPNWLQFIATPPRLEYPAAHAFITGAAMKETEKVLRDQIKIAEHTYDFRGWSPRTYNSVLMSERRSAFQGYMVAFITSHSSKSESSWLKPGAVISEG